MTCRFTRLAAFTLVLAGAFTTSAAAQKKTTAAASDPRLERLKTEALQKVDARAKLMQQIIDQV